MRGVPQGYRGGQLMKRSGAISPILLILCGTWLTLAPGLDAQARAPRVLSLVASLKGNDEVELRWPTAVAAASASEVVVADAFGPRLLLFRRIGVTWTLDAHVSLPGTPVSMIHDGERYVAALRDGQGLVALEGSELAPRELPLPGGVVPGPLARAGDGELLVYDFNRGRVIQLSTAGEITRQVPVEGQVTAIAGNPSGGFLAAVASEGSVLSFDANWKLADTWEVPGEGPKPAWPVALAVEPGGEVLVVDRHGGRFLVLDGDGSWVGQGARRGWEPGLLRFPAGMARLPDGGILVADQGNGRAQIFRHTIGGSAP